jgi:hypothetical protein
MPYGPPTKGGKETPEFTSFMERCVPKVKAKGGGNAYAICKAQWQKSHGEVKDLAKELRR